MESLEEKINPPPKPYRVSTFSKKCFFFLFIFSVGFYFFLVINKRITIKNYIYENQINPIILNHEILPNFTLLDLKNNKNIDIQNLKGKNLLIHFWATWCNTCIMEMPHLLKLKEEMKEKLIVLTIAIDDDKASVINFLNQSQLKLNILFDEEKKITNYFLIKSVPETFLVNDKSEIIAKFEGARNWDSSYVIDYLKNTLHM